MTDRAFPARIAKADGARQIAYAVVLEPRTEANPDSQGDWYTAEDIEKAAHDFLAEVAKGEAYPDLMHEDGCPPIGDLVESYIAPVDFAWGEGERAQVVKAGSWVAAVHYPDPAVWDRVQKGELAAFSVGGIGKRIWQ